MRITTLSFTLNSLVTTISILLFVKKIGYETQKFSPIAFN